MLAGLFWCARVALIASCVGWVAVRHPRAVRLHYYGEAECRPLTIEPWIGRTPRVWRRPLRRLDHACFLVWWHWHFVAGIRWADPLAQIVGVFTEDHPLLRDPKGATHRAGHVTGDRL